MALIFATAVVHAQVSVNLKALDTLGQTREPPPARSHFAPPRRATGQAASRLPLPPTPPLATPRAQGSAMAAPDIGPLPAPPPEAPPPLPVIAPVVLVGPPHPEPMPPPPAVSASAPGLVSALPGGLRVTFGPREAALNPTTLHALRTLARAAADLHVRSVSVDAYAPDDPSDPSTPRRLSLARGLAVRAIFREAGVPSEKIYVRALLADQGAAAPPNRADVTIAPATKAKP